MAPERDLHEFMDRVAAHYGVPIALISIVTADRQFWTAGCGIPSDLRGERGTPRRDSFCTHSVAARSALVVQDSRENPFFRDNPLIRSQGFRFYAGVPLISRQSEVLGTLCLLDLKPRSFTHADLELLSVFGRCVMAAIERREQDAKPDLPGSAFTHLGYHDEELDVFGALAFRDLAMVEAVRGAERARPHRRLCGHGGRAGRSPGAGGRGAAPARRARPDRPPGALSPRLARPGT